VGEAVSDVLLKHLDALTATLALMQGQIAAARHAVSMQMAASVPTLRPVKLERCEGVRDDYCALLNEDARQERGSFTEPHAATCRGCNARLDLA